MGIIEYKTNMYDANYDKTIFQRLVSGVYYAFVSMTTTGYGDYAPDSVPGKIYAIILLLFGTVSISLLTATIASVLVERRLKEGRGLRDLSFMKNHFIICGWKKNMGMVLNDILVKNMEFKPEDIVLIANVDPDQLEVIKQQNPFLRDINHLRGDYYNEAMLKRANVEAARQVFILADESADGLSATETDSKTVMAAMTIVALAREARICAELLDTKYERYLMNAHVDEIIYTNEYSRLLLANSSASTGFTNVINDLLDIQSPINICTHEFPEEFVGKPYYDLRAYFAEKTNANLIGLIENVGSYWLHKQEAIKEAQKTPDISKLVSNLQQVKSMESNNPNLHPDDDYIVPKNSLAVVIERSS